MAKVYCARLDDGVVNRARVRQTGTIIYVCEECDATWLDGDAIRRDNWQDLQACLSTLGVQGRWSQLEDVEEEWR